MACKPFVAVLAAVLAAGCTRYEQKPLPFREPSSYPNTAQVFGAVLGAEAFDDRARSEQVFGFDILGAGVLPVQLAFDHRGDAPIEIVADQTFLVDASGQLWNVLDQRLASDRIAKKTELGEVAPQAGKGAFLGAAAGAVVGAAIGIVTGRSIGEAAGKGAAVGGAGGAVLGGSKGTQDASPGRKIADDLRSRTLENRPIAPQTLSQGVLFFPAEAVSARTLRVQLRNTRTGETALMTFAL